MQVPKIFPKLLKFKEDVTRGDLPQFAASSFILATKDMINVFTYSPKENLFKQTQVDVQMEVDEGEELRIDDITACIAFRVNKHDPYLKPYAKPKSKKFIVITGHKNGKVCYWQNNSYFGQLDNYKTEIVSIVSYSKGVVIATAKSELHFVSFSFLAYRAVGPEPQAQLQKHGHQLAAVQALQPGDHLARDFAR